MGLCKLGHIDPLKVSLSLKLHYVMAAAWSRVNENPSRVTIRPQPTKLPFSNSFG
jgi:hypothetical protein